jgi:hypothetical protein
MDVAAPLAPPATPTAEVPIAAVADRDRDGDLDGGREGWPGLYGDFGGRRGPAELDGRGNELEETDRVPDEDIRVGVEGSTATSS